jgi:dipeptidyl aminopeptidase/acylaminoacyl peptidase
VRKSPPRLQLGRWIDTFRRMKQYFASSLAALVLIAAVPALARPMTETDLATMKRLSSPTASPDGKTIAYQVQETDLPANKRRSDIYISWLDIAANSGIKIASEPGSNEHSPAFSADGKYLYFLSNKSGSDQLYRVAANNGPLRLDPKPEQVSNFKTDIAGFKLSPDGKLIAIWGDVARECGSFDCEKDGDTSKPGPGTGREYNELLARHWDSWETPGNYSRVFTFGIGGDGKLYGGHPLDSHLLDKEGIKKPKLVGDAPSKPFGGTEEVSWSADSNNVYYAMRLADKNEATSTNLDIYSSHQNYDSATNLTPTNTATDTLPAASPDGKWLAWAAMARPGYEADRQVVMLRDLKSGKDKALTAKWDRSVASIAWAPDSKSLFVTAGEILDHPLFKIDLKGTVTRLSTDGNVSDVIPFKDGSLLYTLNSVIAPNDLYLRDAKGGVKKLTDVNGALETDIDDVIVQRFDFGGANGDQVFGQITKPRDAKGTLPVVFIIHGGPQGSFGDSWSYRWNPRVMASQGYAVVSVDFHGSTGYGQAFTDAINKNWGGWPLEDLKKGLTAAGKVDPQIDIKNACAMGGSYGGYMTNWIAGNWPDGFKCLVTHAGVFDLRSMAFETEELWFDEWENGGPWWKRTDAERWNPVNHVSKWKTPMLVIHGEKDFRIAYSQSLAAFTALQRQGVESKLLIFPDENHWILKPQNSIQWHQTVFAWLSKHLKGGN